MATQWYIYKDGAQQGPFPEHALHQLYQEGKLLPADQLWHAGLDGWTPVARLQGLFGSIAPPAGMSHPSTGHSAGAPAAMDSRNGQAASGFNESVFGCFSVNRREKFILSKMFAIAVTSRRLVFAHVSKQAQNALLKEINMASKGQGILKTIGNQMAWHSELMSRFQQMGPDGMLSFSPESFAIDHQQIRQIKLQTHSYRDETHGSSHPSVSLVIKSSHGTIKCSLTNYEKSLDARRILTQALPGKIK